MANEITVNPSLAFTKSGVTESKIWSKTVDMSGTNYNATIAAVTTSITNIPVGSVATNGFVQMRNLDGTNYVSWGQNVSGTLTIVGKMLPGESAGPFRLDPSITFALQANSATCNVEILLIEA